MEITTCPAIENFGNRITKYTYDSPDTVKSTPRKYKINPKALKHDDQPDSKIKKSSSLHNIKCLDDNMSERDLSDQNFTSIQGLVGRTAGAVNTADYKTFNLNSDLLSRIDKEKKSYESKISELKKLNENRKRDNEILVYEKRNLIERLKSYHKEIKALHGDCDKLKTKLDELDVDYVPLIGDVERFGGDDSRRDFTNGCGDSGMDGESVAQATIGDSISIRDDISDDSQILDSSLSQTKTENELLKNLSAETLHDRILKMEEDNYCTREELQATMQELNDLQRAIDKANEENRDLYSERNILLETINEQTKRTESANVSIEILKRLLLNDLPVKLNSDNVQRDYRQLYENSTAENDILKDINEGFKDTLLTYTLECKELTHQIEKLNQEQFELKNANIKLEEQLKNEKKLREQVEVLLRQNKQINRPENFTWTDCSSEVLSLIQQNKQLKTQEMDTQIELEHQYDKIQHLNTKIEQFEEKTNQDLQVNKENETQLSRDVEQLQSVIFDQTKEIDFAFKTIDCLRESYTKDKIEWKQYESDLLMSIVAANNLKEDTEKELTSVKNRLHEIEIEKTKLTEKLIELTNIDQNDSSVDNNKFKRNNNCIHCSNASASNIANNSRSSIGKKTSIDQGTALSVKMLISQIEHQARSSSSFKSKEMSESVIESSTTNTNSPVTKDSNVQSQTFTPKSTTKNVPPPINISNTLPRSNTVIKTSNNIPSASMTKSTITSLPKSASLSSKTLDLSTPSFSTSNKPKTNINNRSNTVEESSTKSRSSDVRDITNLPTKNNFQNNELVKNNGDKPPVKSSSNSNLNTARDHLTRTPTIGGRISKDTLIHHHIHHRHYPILESVTISMEPQTTNLPSNVTGTVANTAKTTSTTELTAFSKPKTTETKETISPKESSPVISASVNTGPNKNSEKSLQSQDPLVLLVKKTNKGSKRNALLFWCQQKLHSYYPKVEITNFSSSWNDGLALCALLHSCDSKMIDYASLAEATINGSNGVDRKQKRINFQAAFEAAEKAGIQAHLDLETMVTNERPEWNMVMKYVVEIFKKFDA